MDTRALLDVIARKHTSVCCGLDPDVRRFPCEFASLPPEEATTQFLGEIIDLTIHKVAAYKLQKAFFEQLPDGHGLIRRLVAAIRRRDPRVFVILDCKVGDISNTMDAYYRSYFEDLGVDAVVLNPYMGTDVWQALGNRLDRVGIVLVRTSNPSAGAIQDVLLQDGRPLWRLVLDKVLDQWRVSQNVMPVIAATADIGMTALWQLLPDEMPVLIAGVGAQGGSISSGTLSPPAGPARVLVNSSRGILYPYAQGERDWRHAVTAATDALQRLVETGM